MIRIPLNKQDQTKIAMDLKEFTKNERQIGEAKDKLKAQFLGLDQIINQVIDKMRTWYHIPHFQNKPLVINLWGSAGVGKSQLIKSLIEKLGLEFSSIKISSKDWHANHILESLSTLQIAKYPVRAVFCVDDFQNFLKSNSTNYPMDKPENSFLWEVLDDGMIKTPKKSRHEFEILEGISKGLSFMIKSGLKVENGFVCREFIKDFKKNKSYWEYHGKSVPKNWEDSIDSNAETEFVFNYNETKILFDSGHHGIENLENFIAHLKTLDQHEILDLVNLILQRSLQYDKVDLSQSIFFVIGNLEELEIQETNPNNMYSGINSPDQLREILSHHLPAELIARLGNNHIFIPKPEKQEFEKIIQKELKVIQSNFEKETGAALEFDTSVVDWVFDEGVISGLGIRPVFSTIQQTITDNLPAIIFGLLGFKNKADKVTIAMDNGLDVKYWKGEKSILKSWHPIASKRKKAMLKNGEIQ